MLCPKTKQLVIGVATAVHTPFTVTLSPTHLLGKAVSHSAVPFLNVETSPVNKLYDEKVHFEQSVAVVHVSQFAIQDLHVLAAASNQNFVLHVAHFSGAAGSVHVLHLLAAVHAVHTLALVILIYPSLQVSHSLSFEHTLQVVSLHGQAFLFSFLPSYF